MRITALAFFVVLLGVAPISQPAMPDEAASHYNRANALVTKGELDGAVQPNKVGLRSECSTTRRTRL